MNSSAFKGVNRDVVSQYGGGGGRMLSVTDHTQPLGTMGKETLGRFQWEAHSVVCGCMDTQSLKLIRLKPSYLHMYLMQRHSHQAHYRR